MATDKEQLNGSNVPNPVRPRSFTNPDDVYDDVVGFDHPHNFFQPGYFRPMWRIRPAAIVQNRITTVQSQAGSGNQSAPAQIYKQGAVTSPSTTSTALKAVPDMNLSINTTGAVQVGFQITATSTAAASYAIYRDGTRISPIFQESGSPYTMSQTIVDNPPTGTHSYSLYWATTGGTVTATGKARSIYAINLKPV
jgi:hypothetical protein